ncbi:coenzyme q10 biosynthesis protein [Culex quinquefasciatus]|uniref:5-demethoxyubiquinone hydroxylase, mitochondrial n=1 Tax=Culex quinquefasciatus TaxID=7176 RepID=B0W9F1_CULQU|nr:coenzyme q10 biosynthesis protein [Culex quinquefasciatus]|eukprot:XP_001845335.1 coenzyme q10 biosynthesis protein [Culex quinquefasciatus]
MLRQTICSRGLHLSAGTGTKRCPEMIDRIIRVDHAGELGANQIYKGQLAVLGHTKAGKTIEHMWEQEKVHKAEFDRLMVKYRARPTALLPFWNLAGFALGAGTALLGEKAAMACTVAVESVIVEHYNDQLRQMMDDPKFKEHELLEIVTRFRNEEQEHHDIGLEEGAEQAPFYKALTDVIKFGCKTAIKIAERV